MSVITVPEDRLLYRGFPDLLALIPSVDLRQRAGAGVQADLSIRGSTFGQTLVLLNGIRINDVQSGHHNMDIPVPLETVDRIEVLRGSGSTLYGSDAVGGVVNVITRKPEASEFRIGAGFGNFGVKQQHGTATLVRDRVSEQFSFSRDFSTGFQPDRDYRNLSLVSDTFLSTPLGDTEVLLAINDKPFGADQFYGNYNSWERTKTWYASIRQPLGGKTETFFAYRRHTDLFVLYRDRPQVFTNRHIVETWLRRREALSRNATLNYGAEGFHDYIDSNNLGVHSRSRAAAYTGLDVRALGRFSFTIGAREEVYRRWSGQFSPTVAGGVWLSPRLKLRASASRAFRLPTYTDLYYHDPANIGTPGLRPEKAWSYEGGLSWNVNGAWKGDVTYFERLERDGIDYVRGSPTEFWRATNFQRLHFRGLEAGTNARLPKGQLLGFDYTYLRGAQDLLTGIQSRYVFNYPSNTALVTWTGTLPGHITARSRAGVTQRLARDAYAVWDVSASGNYGRLHPYLQVSNLTSARYQEILGVPMPTRGIIAGLDVVVFGRR
ncbi:MAG: TonB-dependent receptor [Acidobacteria bacterium]|nr:TonB-dependent receptor [Acidobacteriota bacterium]